MDATHRAGVMIDTLEGMDSGGEGGREIASGSSVEDVEEATFDGVAA